MRDPVVSATEGVCHCAAIAGSGVPPAPNDWFGPPFSPSDARGVLHSAACRPSNPFTGMFARASAVPSFQPRAVGVPHIFAAIANGVPMPLPLFAVNFTRSLRARNVSGVSPSCITLASGVGHAEDEDALSFVRRADLCRREQSALHIETKSSKVSPYALGAAGREHPLDVFDEHEPRPRLGDDAPRAGPQVALVIGAEPLSGDGMGLARDAANDAIHKATPWSAVEGLHIAPYRRGSHETVFHRRNQMGDGECFPLHIHDCASVWNCQFDTEIESVSSGADRDDVERGT